MNDRIKELCSKIQSETDSDKLSQLVAELQALLDQHFRDRNQGTPPANQKAS